jgi:predicted PurR-regulated permease PerM
MNKLIVFIGLTFILWIGRSIFVPIFIAAFFWYLINAISAYYRKVMPYHSNEKKTTISGAFNLLSKILSIATFGFLIYMFVTQIQPMFSELFINIPEIQSKLNLMADYFSGILGLSLNFGNIFNISSILNSISLSAANIAATSAMVLVYIFFMFIEQSTFRKKLDALFNDKRKSKKLSYILQSIDTNMKKYMFMKTFVSGATALMSYLWLNYLGLEFAGVWAFIIFIMNYIPTFGSIVACGMPILYALVATNTMNMPILVAGGLIILQILLGNLLEPKLTGKTLNLSTLAILINLVFWGMLWGPAGMFFSVPILVAIFVITAQFDGTRPVAVLLSANGEIPEKKDDD